MSYQGETFELDCQLVKHLDNSMLLWIWPPSGDPIKTVIPYSQVEEDRDELEMYDSGDEFSLCIAVWLLEKEGLV